MSKNPRIYLAAPFFTPEQLSFVTDIEKLIIDAGYDLFSPRLGGNALEMNEQIAAQKKWDNDKRLRRTSPKTTGEPRPPKPSPPSQELRRAVFNDNWMNIDDADLVVAVIDDRDVGTVWEMGYAFAKHVPIITTTRADYGMNLMLAECIIGHTKTLEELSAALSLGYPNIGFDTQTEDWGGTIALIQTRFKTELALKEGPNERQRD